MLILISSYKVRKLAFNGYRYLLDFTIVVSLIIYFALMWWMNDWFGFPVLTENVYYGIFGRIFLNYNTYLELGVIFVLTMFPDKAV